MTDLIERQAVLDALHKMLPYPTEACAIVRGVPAHAEEDGTLCEWCRMPFPSHSMNCDLDSRCIQEAGNAVPKDDAK